MNPSKPTVIDMRNAYEQLAKWTDDTGTSASYKMKSTLEMVREFHTAFSVIVAAKPFVRIGAINKLRVRLLREEVDELEAALLLHDEVASLDALTDIQYILDGSYLSLGLWPLKQKAFEEVHRSNMSKLGADGKPIVRHDGKILKGPSYTPPDLGRLFR